MKQLPTVYLLIIGIGILATLAGLYQAFTGAPFGDYFTSIFIGVTLVGSAWYGGKKQSES